MTSAIDATKPAEGTAYTADVRSNFAIARDEISALQGQVAALQNRVDTLAVAYGGVGTWSWQASALTPTGRAPPTKPTAGVNTDDPTVATTLSLTPADQTGADFSAHLDLLGARDGLIAWQRTNSANRMRFVVTGDASTVGPYVVIPVTLTALTAEPIDGADVNIQFLFSPTGGTTR